MDYLEKAKEVAARAESGAGDTGMLHYEAQTYTAIATAEQLKRIADALTYTRKSGNTVSIVQVVDALNG